jgi:hypothetical protein
MLLVVSSVCRSRVACQFIVRRPMDELVVLLPHGTITFYQKKNTFVADCVLHGKKPKCCRTRTANASDRGGAQGRPLGFLCAYLMHHGGPDVEAPADHYELASGISFEERVAARCALNALPGAGFLLDKERHQRPGEGPEPELSVA